jgi:hypothetical protein
VFEKIVQNDSKNNKIKIKYVLTLKEARYLEKKKKATNNRTIVQMLNTKFKIETLHNTHTKK